MGACAWICNKSQMKCVKLLLLFGGQNLKKKKNTHTKNISQNKQLSETLKYPQLILRSIDETAKWKFCK